MAELKSKDVPGFIRAPDFSYCVFLIYGPDSGYVRECAEAIASKSGVDVSDPFAAIRIDASETTQTSLADEAYTIGMFAGKRVLRVSGAGNDKALIAQLEQIMRDPPTDCFVIVEGAELKKGSALRSAIEKSKTGMAIPCYTDSAQMVQGLIDQAFPANAGQLEPDARQYLASVLGADRGVSRNEIEKLKIYAGDESKVSHSEVAELIGDSSESNIYELVDTVITGNVQGFDAAFLKLEQSGANINPLLSACQRQFLQLDQLRAIMDKERKAASAAVASAKPPIFFARRRTMETALAIWTAPACRHALQKLRDVVLQARAIGSLDFQTVHICLLGLTIAARRRR